MAKSNEVDGTLRKGRLPKSEAVVTKTKDNTGLAKKLASQHPDNDHHKSVDTTGHINRGNN